MRAVRDLTAGSWSGAHIPLSHQITGQTAAGMSVYCSVKAPTPLYLVNAYEERLMFLINERNRKLSAESPSSRTHSRPDWRGVQGAGIGVSIFSHAIYTH
jgi:hypothetical protein